MSKIKSNDFEIIIKELLLSKKEMFKKNLNIDIEKRYTAFFWLSRGKNINIRIIKYRLNLVINLLLTLNNRFPSKDVKLESCIAIVYLKSEYQNEYKELINEEKVDGIYSFQLKKIIEHFIKNKSLEHFNSEILNNNLDLKQDLLNLLENGYIEYNCEMYCFNFPKGNKMFDVYENEIYNCFLFDKEYESDDKKIKSVLNNSNECLLEAIRTRKKLGINFPKNIFDRQSILEETFKNVSKEDKKLIFKNMLSIDSQHINSTIQRLDSYNKISLNDDEITHYLESIKEDFREKTDPKVIPEIRLKLLRLFKNSQKLLKPLYDELFPEITDAELENIDDYETMISLIIPNHVDIDNINYIVRNIDRVFKKKNFSELVKFLKRLNEKLIDYFAKNSKLLKRLNKSNKNIFYNEFKTYILLDSLEDIELFISNIELSFEDLEIIAVNLHSEKIISNDKYSNFVNKIPNLNLATLNYLCTDSCVFNVNQSIINNFKKCKNYYGVLKFSSIKECKIPFFNYNCYKKEYGKIYSNSNHIYDNIFPNSTEVVNYLMLKKLYKQYDSKFLKNMCYCNQDYELLQYVFENIKDLECINNYIKNIFGIVCTYDELLKLIENYQMIFSKIDNVAYKNLIRNIKDSKLKRKLYYLNKKLKGKSLSKS